MAYSSSSQGGRLCNCGQEAVLSRSGTQANPGRLFWGCANWRRKNCGYFKWASVAEATRSEHGGSWSCRDSRLVKEEEVSGASVAACVGDAAPVNGVVVGSFHEIVSGVVLIVILGIIVGFVLGKL